MTTATRCARLGRSGAREGVEALTAAQAWVDQRAVACLPARPARPPTPPWLTPPQVAGTVGLMTTPVMGLDAPAAPPERVLRAALALGTANQLTNILRDVGEDAAVRNRIYVPLDELEAFGIAEPEARGDYGAWAAWAVWPGGHRARGLPFSSSPCAHVLCLPTTCQVARATLVSAGGAVDPRWVEFMRFQIARARRAFAEAEAGVGALAPDARWPVWSALILYRWVQGRRSWGEVEEVGGLRVPLRARRQTPLCPRPRPPTTPMNAAVKSWTPSRPTGTTTSRGGRT